MRQGINMIKILHCADLHLDSPFRQKSIEKSRIRREELKKTFLSLITYIKTAGIDICLIAGDLFDSNFVTDSTAELVRREFAEASGCRFVISPGNHDPYTANSVYSSVCFSDNVYIFKKSELECFSFTDIETDVYGYAFTSGTLESNPFAGKRPLRPERINLLCAHGDTSSPISVYCPVTREDILRGGFDYVALGHIHSTTGIEHEGNTWFGYSGCLEGRDFGEPGHHGAMVASIEKTYAVCRISVNGIRFSRRRYETCRLDITGCGDMSAVEEKIHNAMQEKRYGGDTILRIELCGEVPADLVIDIASLSRRLNGLVFELEITDRTLPLYDGEYLENDPTVRGEFYRKLLPLLREGTPEERAEAAQALRMGLAALRGEDILI